MEWFEDDEVWESLDDLMINLSPALLRMLKALENHEADMNFYMKALLFGGLGQFTVTYTRERGIMTNEIEAFDKAVASVASNPYVMQMMKQVVAGSVDNNVAKMVGENE